MIDFVIEPGKLTLAQCRHLMRGGLQLSLHASALQAIEDSAATVQRAVQAGLPAYGINTGFGKLAKTHIPDAQLEQLQLNLVRSHAVGIGPLLDDATVRLMLALKAASLARGFSGVRPLLIDALLALYNADVLPCIPAKGSVGASGDLAPLAHLTMPLLGEGEVRIDGETMPALEGLKRVGLEPIRLGPKEGLALLNGTQASTALALRGLFEAEDLFAAAVAIGALSVDAARGSDAPFDPRVHAVRGQPGQIETAAAYRSLLAGSAIRASHLDHDDRVQDPYSLRCQPQVMGACLDLIRNVAQTLVIEANAVTDNPLAFAGEEGAPGEVISGGNFHAEPVALAADTLALAIAEIGALSERRIALLIDATLSGLPPFLVREPGLNSGFMMAHVTAAALASENKSLAHPASVDSLPTSANQEDHVSMATFAARRLLEMCANTRGIVAIEWLTAAQGVDFHAPLKTSAKLQTVRDALRTRVSFYESDRYFAPDIAAAVALLENGALNGIAMSLAAVPEHTVMQRYFAGSALLPAGWAQNVLIGVDADGVIADVQPGASAEKAEKLAGPIIPGMPNLHSHAFQRAMAGLTEKGGPQGDSFWSWRKLMYRFLENLNPDDVEVIATQLYIEMLQAGYTSVAEFHYLHHDPAGVPYANPAETGERIIAAAAATGIGLTLLPVFYAHGNFGGAEPAAGQRRFISSRDSFARLLESLAVSLKPLSAARIGAAPHSLRAAMPDELRSVVDALNAIDNTAPLHIHAAEQQKEVDDCIAWGGVRPVAWLLENAPLDARWCVVHATHLDAAETAALAHSGAVAGLCPTTEGDLGDGFFNAAPYLRAGGRIGIGGDSHVGVDPFLELRLFEYGQRLRLEKRNVLAATIGDSLGGQLYRSTCAGGAQALGQPVGRIEPGGRADWVVLNTDDPAMAEQSGDGLLDAAIFGPVRAPVRDVMVGGRWQVRDGRHPLAAASLARYRVVMKRLLH